jgi:UDP-N-acetylglucosamine--N-acetylmuramyl-(pentapeptide) pyrophosphoryl-undecaprenol N-acetylglucosamine transferase
MLTIALAGGGTGGHIYPGLAVAGELRKEGAELFWIGSRGGMDRSIVENAGLPFFGIPAGKLRRYLTIKNFADLFRVAGGFFAARRILKKKKPAVLFSKGGFVSVPPCAAAFSLGIPVFTHESDASPGLATRINARFARGIFTAYAQTIPLLGKYSGRAKVSGNPVRRDFFQARGEQGRAFLGLKDRRPVLLVLGGSQGALEINELVAAWLPELTSRFTVVHQTGARWEGPPESERYKPCPYIKEEMPQVLAASDLVLGRSGAGTLWECAALGKPMVLIPLRGSGTRGDQVENAEIFRKAGAAIVLESGELRDRRGLSRILSLAADDEKLKLMARAALEMGRPEAAAFIAGELLAAAGGPAGSL